MILKLRLMSGCFHAVDAATREFAAKLMTHSEIQVNYTESNPGELSLLNTWRMWMRETSIAMSGYGCQMPLYIDKSGNAKGSRQYNEHDAHEQFTSIYLGVDDKGKRKSWSRSRSGDTVQASKTDRLWAMDRHLEWCTEKGIKLTIPEKSEYQEHRKSGG